MGKNSFIGKLKKMKTGFILCFLLVIAYFFIPMQQNPCILSSFKLLQKISQYSNLISSNKSSKIITSMIQRLTEVKEISNNIRQSCRNHLSHVVTYSNASWNAFECLQNIESLSFKSTFAVHAFTTTDDRDYALQNMNELASSMHGFMLNCTIAVLTFNAEDPKKGACGIKRRSVALANKEMQEKLFLKPFDKEEAVFEKNLIGYTRDCIVRSRRKNSGIKAKYVSCSLQLMAIQDLILSSTKIETKGPGKIVNLGKFKRSLLYLSLIHI
eukprot:TRINITY_DN5366_c0_g1_i1.p1 TRINITY_DN5366_c0_g1~~TRINITY_DN5366_c0_g1_i1.p1  ORF type:complete len:270 (+),score=24.89 TRINITY_DN5366_c0_g1_i1:110-919(+)